MWSTHVSNPTLDAIRNNDLNELKRLEGTNAALHPNGVVHEEVGETTALFAVRKQATRIVTHYLQCGDDVRWDVVVRHPNHANTCTVLHSAINLLHVEDALTYIPKFVERGADLFVHDEQVERVLEFAIREGADLKVIQLLLELMMKDERRAHQLHYMGDGAGVILTVGEERDAKRKTELLLLLLCFGVDIHQRSLDGHSLILPSASFPVLVRFGAVQLFSHLELCCNTQFKVASTLADVLGVSPLQCCHTDGDSVQMLFHVDAEFFTKNNPL